MTDDVNDFGDQVDRAVENAIKRLRGDFSKETVEQTESRLRALKGELEDAMQSLHAGDRREREELRDESNKINEFVKQLKDAKTSQTDSGGSTIVIPASQVDEHKTKEQESDKPTDSATVTPETSRKGGWKKWW